jgi:hypothetical protein
LLSQTHDQKIEEFWHSSSQNNVFYSSDNLKKPDLMQSGSQDNVTLSKRLVEGSLKKLDLTKVGGDTWSINPSSLD